LKRSITTAVLTIFFLIFFYSPASSTTWYLNPSGPLTIQEAINNAATGDTILLSPGTYTGEGNRAVDFGGKEVVVTSSGGPEVTVIDCESTARAFILRNGEGPNAVIRGLTLTKCSPSEGLDGGAILLDNASPKIIDNIITNCSSGCSMVEPSPIPFAICGKGGAIWSQGGAPLIAYNKIMDNVSEGGGGAIYLYDSEAHLIGNHIIHNTYGECCVDYAPLYPGGGVYASESNLYIEDNIFWQNLAFQANGCAIYLNIGSCTIRNCTFVNEHQYSNVSPLMLGSISAPGTDLTVENSIFVKVPAAILSTSEITPDQDIIQAITSGDPLLRCNDFFGFRPYHLYGWNSFDNINADPMFADAANGDFTLLPGSPCLPDGNVCGIRMGARFPPLYHVGADTVRVFPGGNVCARFFLEPPQPGIEVTFEVTGANYFSATALTNERGEVNCCYPAGDLGIDNITATAVTTNVIGPDTLSENFQLKLLPPRLAVDSFYHGSTVSMLTLPGMDICSHFRLDPPRPGIEVVFETAGANTESGTAISNDEGEVYWCYPVGNVGKDIVTATAQLTYDSGTVAISGNVEYTLLPPILSVDPAWHSGSDSLRVAPDSNVCTHFKLTPVVAGAEVAFEVFGANAYSGSATTNDNGEVFWCYPARNAGRDSVRAAASFAYSAGTITASNSLELTLLPAEFHFDPGKHWSVQAVPAVPGINLCGHFITDPPVAGAHVSLRVRGANHLDFPDTATTATDGTVSLCYTAARVGIDTVTATAELKYGDTVYDRSSSLVFGMVPQTFEPDPDYNSIRNTVITSTGATVYTHFRVVPPHSGISVSAEVTGANSFTMSGTTDEQGHVLLGYPAQHLGVDTVTATAEFVLFGTPYYAHTGMELVLVDGNTIAPTTELSAGVESSGDELWISLTSNKALIAPPATFKFELVSGAIIMSKKTMDVDPYKWIYTTSFDVIYPGRLTVRIITRDLFEYAVNESRSYDIAKAIRGEMLNFSSNDGEVGIYAPFGFIDKDGIILFERESEWSGPAMDDSGSPLVPASQRFKISANAVLLADPQLIIRHTYREILTPGQDLRRVGIYRRSGSVWTYVGGQGDAETVRASVELPGVFAAFYNEAHDVVPEITRLHQNFPNPFRANTTIVFDLNPGGSAMLTIHDVAGRRVRTLRNGLFPEGVYQVEWDGRGDSGETVASGVYFYRLDTGSFTSTKKMLLLR